MLKRAFANTIRYVKKRIEEDESGCGKCAVCRRVCQMLERKKLPEEENNGQLSQSAVSQSAGRAKH